MKPECCVLIKHLSRHCKVHKSLDLGNLLLLPLCMFLLSCFYLLPYVGFFNFPLIYVFFFHFVSFFFSILVCLFIFLVIICYLDLSTWISLGSKCLLYNVWAYSGSNRLRILPVAANRLHSLLSFGGIESFNFYMYFFVFRI